MHGQGLEGSLCDFKHFLHLCCKHVSVENRSPARGPPSDPAAALALSTRPSLDEVCHSVLRLFAMQSFKNHFPLLFKIMTD